MTFEYTSSTKSSFIKFDNRCAKSPEFVITPIIPIIKKSRTHLKLGSFV